jgi:ATP-dependent DNA helicase RecG
MVLNRDADDLSSLVRELVKLPKETEWVEFKHNNTDPEEIGEYISALANSAALCGKTTAYLVWGIDDSSHEILGTFFDPASAKTGNEELENWLLRLLTPKVNFKFYSIAVETHTVVVLEIERARQTPVQFKGAEFIRVGSYKKRLKDYLEKERELWRVFDQVPFERLLAAEKLTADKVLQLLNYPAYFELLHLPLPESGAIIKALVAEGLAIENGAGKYDITNLGAILFAKNLGDFPTIRRKAIRVIAYRGPGRVETIREWDGVKGYAVGFEGLLEHITSLVPSNEIISKALRKEAPMYPALAVRELVANALIHQDFSITGSGPMIELFGDRLEITNPGQPLVKTERFLDNPPRSRNEALASFMRRIGVCEERGSGIDKVVFQTELYQLPAPSFESIEDNTRAVLFAHRPLSKMDKVDRIRACYLHACLRYVNRDFMTNTSLRERFKIKEQNSATASRYIKEAIESKQIRPFDEKSGPKQRKYVPYWAKA